MNSGPKQRSGSMNALAFVPYLFPLGFLLLFFIYPMASILETGLMEDGELTLDHFSKIYDTPRYRRVISFTIKQAFLSSMATMLLGLPAAYLLSRHHFPGKNMVKALLTVPFVLPTITVSIGFILLFGRNGLVNDFLDLFWERKKLLYNLQAIVLAHTFFNFAIVVRLVGSSWAGLNPRMQEAAGSLGAQPWKCFLFVTLPMLMPSILASFILTFMYCFMSFTIVLVLGGPSLTTMEVEIFTLNSTFVNYELASALALIQLSFTILFLYLYMNISSRLPDAVQEENPISGGRRRSDKQGTESWRSRLKNSFRIPTLKSVGNSLILWKHRLTLRNVMVFLYIILVGLIIVGPMAEVVRHSFLVRDGNEESYSFEWYRRIYDDSSSPAGISPVDAIINTLFFAFMTVMISVPLGTTIAYFLHSRDFWGKNIVGAIFLLPLGISAITLALGLLRRYPTGSLTLGGTWYGIVIAHTILAYPFVMRSVSSSLKSFNPHLTEAAMSLGADRTVSFFRVEVPHIMPGILVGAIFAFSISVGELGATFMLYRPENATLPMVIYRYIGSRDFGVGIALSVVLMIIVFLSFLLIEKAGKGSGF